MLMRLGFGLSPGVAPVSVLKDATTRARCRALRQFFCARLGVWACS